MRLTPIIVEADTPCGFAASDPWSPSLDGLLSWAFMKEKLGPDFGLRLDIRPVEGLPLACERWGDLWWYVSGLPEYAPLKQREVHFQRRFDALDAERFLVGRKRIETAAGPFKNMRKPRFQQVAGTVRWHAIGDPDEVRRLLVTHFPAIGVASSRGMGKVTEWRVTEGGDGKVRRALPHGYATYHGVRGRNIHMGIRPPYWLEENQTMCVLSDEPWEHLYWQEGAVAPIASKASALSPETAMLQEFFLAATDDGPSLSERGAR